MYVQYLRGKGSAFGYPFNYCCAVGRLKSPISYIPAFIWWIVKGDTLIAFIYSRGVLFWSKAYIITSEEADKLVAKAIPNRNTKAIPNINAGFLFISTKLLR